MVVWQTESPRERHERRRPAADRGRCPASARGWVRSVSASLARPNLPGMTPGSNPYLFVVGAARSGTTLLQRMLDAHPLLAVVNETYLLPRQYRERTGLTRGGSVTPALSRCCLTARSSGEWGSTKRISGGSLATARRTAVRNSWEGCSTN